MISFLVFWFYVDKIVLTHQKYSMFKTKINFYFLKCYVSNPDSGKSTFVNWYKKFFYPTGLYTCGKNGFNHILLCHVMQKCLRKPHHRIRTSEYSPTQ